MSINIDDILNEAAADDIDGVGGGDGKFSELDVDAILASHDFDDDSDDVGAPTQDDIAAILAEADSDNDFDDTAVAAAPGGAAADELDDELLAAALRGASAAASESSTSRAAAAATAADAKSTSTSRPSPNTSFTNHDRNGVPKSFPPAASTSSTSRSRAHAPTTSSPHPHPHPQHSTPHDHSSHSLTQDVPPISVGGTGDKTSGAVTSPPNPSTSSSLAPPRASDPATRRQQPPSPMSPVSPVVQPGDDEYERILNEILAEGSDDDDDEGGGGVDKASSGALVDRSGSDLVVDDDDLLRMAAAANRDFDLGVPSGSHMSSSGVSGGGRLSAVDVDALIRDLDQSESQAQRQEMIGEAIEQLRNPLDRVKAREDQASSIGNYKMTAPLRQKRSHDKNRPANSYKTPHQNSPHNAVLQVENLEKIGFSMNMQRDKFGTPTSGTIHSKYIGMGSSLSIIFLFDHFQQLSLVLGALEYTRSHGAVTAMDISPSARHLIAGHQGGQLVLWDVAERQVLKRVDQAHDCPVTAVKFCERNGKLRAVSADAKGNVNVYVFSKMFFSFSADKQCLLNGNAGQILSMDVLEANPSAPHPSDQFNVIALCSHDSTLIVALEPSARVLFQIPRPDERHSRAGALPSVSWRQVRRSEVQAAAAAAGAAHRRSSIASTTSSSTVNAAKDEIDPLSHPLLAVARGKYMQLISVYPQFAAAAEPGSAGGASSLQSPGHRSRRSTDASLSGGLRKDSLRQTLTGRSGSRPQQRAVTGLHPKLIEHKVFECEFVSCQWLSGQVLVTLTDRSELHVIDPFPSLRTLEILNMSSTGLVYHELFRNPLTKTPLMAFSNSFVTGGSRPATVLSGSTGTMENKDHVYLNPASPSILPLLQNPLTKTPLMAFSNSFVTGGSRPATVLSASTGTMENKDHAAESEALLCLGVNRIEKCILLSWSDRVNVLVERGEWIEALALALDFYEGCGTATERGTPFLFAMAQAASEEMGYGTATTGLPKDPVKLKRALGPRISKLLQSYVNLALGSATRGAISNASGAMSALASGSVDVEHLQILGGVAIDYCVTIERPDILFQSIYQQFCKVGGEGVFLELLEPYILNGELTSLSAEVMHAFVEHYAVLGKLKEVEQCVLRMRMDAVDTEQVVRLCQKHRLMSALIYVYNRAFQDYESPIDVILGIVLNPNSRMPEHVKENYGYKLLLYIKYALSGRGFPNDILPDGQAPAIQARILRHMFTRHSDHPAAKHFTQAHQAIRHLLTLNARETLKVMQTAFDNEALYPAVGVAERKDKDTADEITDALRRIPNAEEKSDRSRLVAPVAQRSSTPYGGDSLADGLNGRPGAVLGGDSLADGGLDGRPGTPSGMSAALLQRKKKLGRIFDDVQSSVSTFMKQQQQKIAAPRGDGGVVDDAGGASIGSSPQQLSNRFLSSLGMSRGGSLSPSPSPLLTRTASDDQPNPGGGGNSDDQSLASMLPSRQLMLDVITEVVLDDCRHAETRWKPNSGRQTSGTGGGGNGDDQSLASMLPSRQLMLDVITEVVLDDCRHAETRWKPDALTAFYIFAASYIATNVVVAAPEVIADIFSHLLSAPIMPVDGSGDKSPEDAQSSYAAERAERQSVLLSLLERCTTTADGRRPLNLGGSNFDTDEILLQASAAEFFKVTLFLYNERRDYANALDCYMKDREIRPRVFEYISGLLEGTTPGSHEMSQADIKSLKYATLVRIPQLIQVSSEATARLIVRHFADVHNKVMKVLEQHKELQYRYLKSIMARAPSRHSTTQNAAHSVESSPHAIKERRNNLSIHELLQLSSIELTRDMHEKYIELICEFSPSDVHAHLTITRHDFNIDRVLGFCQRYGIKNATSFLLERTGDTIGALGLMLESVEEKAMALRSFFEANLEMFSVFNPDEHLEEPKNFEDLVSDSEEAKSLEDLIGTAIALCQRYSKVKDSESERLWFLLLDKLVHMQSQMKHFDDGTGGDGGSGGDGGKQSGSRSRSRRSRLDREPITDEEKAMESARAERRYKTARVNALMEIALVRNVRTALSQMMGFVALPSILRKITQDHAADQFRDYRDTIVGMLENYRYEQSILVTVNKLFENDLFTNIERLHGMQSKGVIPTSGRCGKCFKALIDLTDASQRIGSGQEISVFPCGHAFHTSCMNGVVDHCPICQRVQDTRRRGVASSSAGASGIAQERRFGGGGTSADDLKSAASLDAQKKSAAASLAAVADRHLISKRSYVDRLDIVSNFYARQFRRRHEQRSHITSKPLRGR